MFGPCYAVSHAIIRQAYTISINKKKLFVAFLGINQLHLVGLRIVCWFYNGNTQRLTESGFMDEPGIEPATPGLQDIGLYPTPRRDHILSYTIVSTSSFLAHSWVIFTT